MFKATNISIVSNPYACASFHVEHVDKEYAAGAGTEVEVQDPEGQHLEEEYEGTDQEPEPEPELTNFYNTQGKPRFILKTQCHYIKFKSYNYYYLCIKFIGVV